MSKIAEQKALEIYPDIEINWTMTDRTKERMIYADGYDQAIQDFLEKAERFIKDNLLVSDLEKHEYFCMTEENKSNFIKDFKNYMQDESEK